MTGTRSHEATINNIQGRLDGFRDVTPYKPTIFLVEDRLRNVNKTDYEPKKVSIGPIHRGKEQVKSMEEHKVRLLRELLTERQDLTLTMLVEEVGKKEEEARKRYSSESINPKNNDNFLETMVFDGCFIIQLLRQYGKLRDPIFEDNTLIQIIHDLLLFENQLPFFVLTALFDKIKTGNPNDHLHDLILFLVDGIVPWLDDSKAHLFPEPNHLLGLVHGCILTKIPWKPYGGERENASTKAKKTPIIHINSASELKEVGGVHLKMCKHDTLTFESKALKLPRFKVSGETESLLRNLMAYEQLHVDDDQPKRVIDYVFFMHCLAKSTKDIQILRYSKIIENYLGGDDQILEMISRLGTHFMRSSDYVYSHVFESLNEHCGNRRNELMANLLRNHLNTPWSVMKVMAAILLLALTATQTVFSILSYMKQMSNPKKN